MQVKLATGSKLFVTDHSAPYDAVIIPAEVGYELPFYARNKQNQQWYGLHASNFPADNTEITQISYEDPHGRINHPQGRIDIIGGNALVMTRPAEYGGDWAVYGLAQDCPEQIDANPLPVDVRRIAFLGVTEDQTERLLVLGSRYYTDYPRVFFGSSFMNMLEEIEELADGPYEPMEGGGRHMLSDGSELVISINTGLPCVYKGKDFYPVDSAAYVVEETIDGARISRKQ